MAEYSSKLTVYAALAGNAAVAATKLAAAIFTGSSAMFSEAVHSLVDTGNEGLLLYGYRQANRRPNRIHPFGYGRELYFWSFIVALALFGLGAGVSLYEGVQHIMNPRPTEHAMVSYIVLGLAFLFESGSWWVAWRGFEEARGQTPFWTAFRQSKDPPAFMVLFEDSAALIGIAIAGAGIFAADHFNQPVFDGIASVLIGLVLAVTAGLLAIESKSLLIGERASPALVTSIQQIAESVPGVIRANSALTAQLSPDQAAVGLNIEFDDALTTPQIEQIVEQIENKVQASHPEVTALFVKPQTPERFEHLSRKRFDPDQM